MKTEASLKLHTSITGSEGDDRLDTFAIFGFLAWHLLVDHLNDCFERSEFHHGVGNLATPERVETFEKTMVPVSLQSSCTGVLR